MIKCVGYPCWSIRENYDWHQLYAYALSYTVYFFLEQLSWAENVKILALDGVFFTAEVNRSQNVTG